jgi:hypothetical protein
MPKRVQIEDSLKAFTDGFKTVVNDAETHAPTSLDTPVVTRKVFKRNGK